MTVFGDLNLKIRNKFWLFYIYEQFKFLLSGVGHEKSFITSEPSWEPEGRFSHDEAYFSVLICSNMIASYTNFSVYHCLLNTLCNHCEFY